MFQARNFKTSPRLIVILAVGLATCLVTATLSSCGSSDGGAPDGGSSTQARQAVAAPNANISFKGVVYGNGTWVAVGDGVATGVAVSSSNGTSWAGAAQTILSNEGASTVAFSNGIFVAAVGDQIVTVSSNGSAWTPQTLHSAQGLGAAIYGNGTWVLLDNHFLTEDVVAVWTSPDGQSWTSVSTAVPYAQPTSVAYGNGQFVLVGYGALVATSPNGSNWIQQPFPFSDGLIGIAFGNGKFVAIGTDSAA